MYIFNTYDMYVNVPSFPSFSNILKLLFSILPKSVQNDSGRSREQPTALKPFKNTSVSNRMATVSLTFVITISYWTCYWICYWLCYWAPRVPAPWYI